jgi:hypothetical protein
MSLIVNNIHLNKLRSYSTVFSAPSFMRLLHDDDFGFLDSKILRYDMHKVGSEIKTYYDYIHYIYRELEKQYRNEYLYKNTIINELLLKKYGVRNTILINEFRVGNSIADIVMFNGTSKAFEIKTELDSNKRLNSQLIDYTKVFSECYIVTHESLSAKYLKEDQHIGVIELVKQNRSIKFKEVRHAKENLQIDPDTLMKTLRTSEYKNIVKAYYGGLPEMNSFNMFEICREMIKQIPSSELHHLFITELKLRKSNTRLMPQIPKELRQICLTLNASEKSCKLLEHKLQQTINF